MPQPAGTLILAPQETDIPAGTHELTRGLSLSVDGVTVRGAGMDRSVLSVRNQAQGAEGLLVNADDFVIEDLAIEDTIGDALKINDSRHIMIVSYHITGLPIDDADYDPFPEAIHNHGNRFSGGGNPDSEPLAALVEATGQAVPAVVWDGTVVPGSGASDILCLADNSGESFVNLDAPGDFAAPSFDTTPHQCSMPALSTISLSAADD